MKSYKCSSNSQEGRCPLTGERLKNDISKP